MVEWIIEVRQPGRTVLSVLLSRTLEIGRDCDGLLLADPKVSRSHVRLMPSTEGVEVVDLGSRNGTWVNGERISAPILVRPADGLVIGDTVLVIGPDASGRSEVLTTWVGDLDPRSSIAAVLGAVRAEDIDHPGVKSSEGTLTILFSDIEGSTALAQELGDQRWLEILAEHNELIRGNLREHAGTEVKTVGDGFMATFPSARTGLVCSVAIQHAISKRAEVDAWPVRVRIGLHTGEALHEGGDIFGTHVNLAARVAARAGGGEILVSGLLHDVVLPVTDVRFSPGAEVELKGLTGLHRIHEVEWRDL